uniref:family 10 glycosylhydrolase n=1 Tax=Daejeonella sp. TaxID=2805397 RepID=UPI0037BE8BBB
MKKNLSFLILCLLALPFFGHSQDFSHPKHEFRGVWIATVANIDWPSKPGLSSDIQKTELIRILDAHQKTGINAVIFQIRPATDALYG